MRKKFQRKKTIFFPTSSFSEKLLFYFFLIHAVKKPLLIVKNLYFSF